MNHLAISGLLVFATSLCSAVFVLSKGPKRDISFTWGLFSLSVACWGLGLFKGFITGTEHIALFWGRFLNLSAIFIAIFFFHFVLCFTNNLKHKKIELLFYYLILVSIFFISIIYPKTFVSNVRPVLSFKYYPAPGFLYYIFTALFVYLETYGVILLFKDLRISSGTRKNQIKYLLMGVFVGFAGGSSTFFPIFKIPIYPLGTYLVIIYVGTVAYAIVRHQLMDIEIVIKKTLVFASLFTVILGIFVGITVLTQSLIAGSSLLGFVISSIIIIFTVRPLEDFLIRITDKYLFQKKYDPFQLLKTFSDEVLASVLDKEAIIKIAVDLLSKALNLETFTVMLINKDGDQYEVAGSSGIDNTLTFSNNDHLIMYLNKTYSPLIRKNHDKTMAVDLLQDMNKIKAELCIPLVFHKHLVGFLAFGKRKSDKEYTNEDLDVLIPLTRDIAIAIVYAGLYEEVRQKDKLATLGTLVAGIKHEIGNPLSSILTIMQLFIRKMDEWDRIGMSQKERDEKVRNMINEVLHEAHRIGRITRKFTDFARPGDEGMKEIVSIKDTLKEALAILENELSLKHIKIEEDISEDAPKIYVDKDQMHQIFFNLLRNAAQAIEESNKPKEEAKISIIVKRKLDKVIIDISDNGCGIPEEKKIKIFEPFYTTKEGGKGTGLGLAIVQQLVGKNRGDISFKSREGEGTTFMLEFPIEKNG